MSFSYILATRTHNILNTEIHVFCQCFVTSKMVREKNRTQINLFYFVVDTFALSPTECGREELQVLKEGRKVMDKHLWG